MKRYIRTKDGQIIDLKRTGLYGLPLYNFDTKENVLKAYRNQEERTCCYIDNNIFYDYCCEDGTIWEHEIVKQADTIQELCDKFVCVGREYRDIFTRISDRSYDPGVFKIYGAIWTEKGLIYVAKLNEKGELELL